MTAEDITYNSQRIKVSIPLGKTIDTIIESFKETTPYFKKHITQFTHKTLNEYDLTQEFVALLRRKTVNSPFLVGQEKADLYHNSGGRVDVYFYWKEETETTESFFDLEAKILTNRFPVKRKKEYVIGENKNGGIQRFKIEKHGKGLPQCGLLGFIEKETSEHWLNSINCWIQELSNSNPTWYDDEVLILKENDLGCTYLLSSAHRPSDKVLLHHFWIK